MSDDAPRRPGMKSKDTILYENPTPEIIELSTDVEIMDTRPPSSRLHQHRVAIIAPRDEDLQILSVTPYSSSRSSSSRLKKSIVDLTTDSSPRPFNPKPTLPEVLVAGAPPSSADSTKSLNNLKCGICLGEVSRPMATVCGHIYCEGCLRLAIRQTGFCPSCRRKLKSKDVHRLYI